VPFVHHIQTTTTWMRADLPDNDRQIVEDFIAKWEGQKGSTGEVTFDGPTRSFTTRYCDITNTWIEEV